MTTGEYHGFSRNTTELVDISGNCSATLPNYPLKTCWATGVFIDGIILICGGYDGYHGDRDSDYKVKILVIFYKKVAAIKLYFYIANNLRKNFPHLYSNINKKYLKTGKNYHLSTFHKNNISI